MPATGREVVIIEAARTPIGRGHLEKGYYKDVHPNALLGCCKIGWDDWQNRVRRRLTIGVHLAVTVMAADDNRARCHISPSR